MFGYICINKPELKIRDFEEYNGFYCGLCQVLQQQSGPLGQMTLTYDMTFLAILLTALYEDEVDRQFRRCPTRPWKKMLRITNRHSTYAADMNVLLASYNLEDDWLDDHSIKGLLLSRLLARARRRIEKNYPRQSKAVAHYLTALHQCEDQQSQDLDCAAGLTGELLGEIFVCQEDEWSAELRRMGFFLGKFIYLMDAYEDVTEDRQKGNYNPWTWLAEDPHFDDNCQQILTMMMAEASRSFERLPILMYGDLLRNILYSGVWSKFAEIRRKHSETKNENNETTNV